MIKVLLATTNEAPYCETAPAEVLSTFNAAVLGSLFKIGPSFDLRPNLVESWKWNFREKAYDLTLRGDIVFHNGRGATAQDLEYSLLRGFFSTHRSFYKLYLENIEGVEAAERLSSFRSGAVSGVQVTGPLSVRIRLKTPNPGFLHSLVDGYFSLVPREAMTDDNVTWKEAPVGAGPFRVAEPFQNGRITIEGVSAPHRKIAIYTRDTEASYDISLVDPEASKLSAYQHHAMELPASVWTMFFSKNHALSQNVHFRRAVSYLVNQEELATGLSECRPTHEMLPRHFWGRAQNQSRFNLASARHEVSLIPANLRTGPIEVAVFAGERLPAYRERILERLTRQFAALGLRISVTLTHDKFLSDADSRRFPIKIFGMVTDYVDPLVMFSGFHRGSPYENLRPYDDRNFEAHYEKATKIDDQEQKMAAVRNISHLVCADALSVPMVEESLVIYHSNGRVRSLGSQYQPLTLVLENVDFRDSP